MIKHLLFCGLLSLTTPLFSQFSGNALDFDGTDDMVVISSVPSFVSTMGTSDFTIEACVNPRGSAFQRIFFSQASATNFVSLGPSTGNVIYFYVVINGTTYSVATTTSITQNAWTHVAARWTAATLTPQVFFNGVVQPTVAGGGSSSGTNGLTVIGSRPGGAQYFNGMLDEVRLWSEARTQCEITNNINNSVTGVQSNLVMNFDFNQGVAAGNNTVVTTLPDNSGNSYNGALTNFTLTAATSNWVTSGATVTSQGNPLGGSMTTQTASQCSGGSYTFPDGSVQSNITSTIVQVSTLTAQNGCDSIITTTVNVNPVYALDDTVWICNGMDFTFPDGTSFVAVTAPMSHVSTLSSINTCDSVVTTYLELYPIYSANDTAWICYGGSYTFHDGTTVTGITSPTSHLSQLATMNACDSLFTTYVDIISVDTMVTMVNETLTANATGATYQWLDCGNGYAPIVGDTNQSFTATVNGTYALAITENGCTDTSGCFVILSTGIQSSGYSVSIFPNPTDGVIYVHTKATGGVITLMDVTGKVVRAVVMNAPTAQLDLTDLSAGIYFLEVNSVDGKVIRKIQKN